MFTTGRGARGVAIALAVALLAGHAHAGTADDGMPQATDVKVAQVLMQDLDRRLDEAQRALAEVDARLATATSRLQGLKAGLAEAEHAHHVAASEAAEAGARLEEADRALSAVISRWRDTRRAFERHVAAAYKYGSSWGAVLLAGSVLQARDLHQMALSMQAVDRVLAADRRAVAEAHRLAMEAADSRRVVAALRREALIEQQQADRARDQVAALVERQRRTVEDIQAQRARRQEILDAVEADREQQMALIRRLEEMLLRLTEELGAQALAPREQRSFDGPTPGWAAALPQSGRQFASAIHAAAGRAGIDGRLLAALVWAESYFQPAAVSAAGAIGLTQLMPATAEALGVDPWDPQQNLLGGSRYLRMQADRFGRVELALAAYNAGPTAVARAGGIPALVETQLYLLRVLTYWERLLRA